ncbi:MAG: glutamate synthase central domain-containing protein, partial [Candidatus Omnitrophota bacterium]
MTMNGFPKKQGLYDPRFEHDSWGVGFVCDIKGKRSHDIVEKGIEVLERLSHRGAVGADPRTGDGAGLLLQVPHDFLKSECAKIGIGLPSKGDYGTGLIFLPQDAEEREMCGDICSGIVNEEGQRLLGWRDVPVAGDVIGEGARSTMPHMSQIFIARGTGVSSEIAFERKLYVIRRQIEKSVLASDIGQKSFFYITNLSSRTLSYKGLLMPSQLKAFFTDLNDKRIESSICLVHSRYSTNTFPTWDLAQPFRFLAHNGEINTLRGNINWTRARERLMTSELFGNDIEKVKPVIVEGGSDSASIDNVFELLTLSGRPLPHVMMMLIPAAWEYDSLMDKGLRDFYRYHACIMEPWDGPAAIAFTDGDTVGAVLDRNGLRPARYIVTGQGQVIMASEVGVIDIEPGDIRISGRLEPGKMFLIDTSAGRIIDDAEIKKGVCEKRRYGKWNSENMVDLDGIVSAGDDSPRVSDRLAYMGSFGYTREDLKVVIKPMAEEGKEPVGSMGNDTPPAVLSSKPQLLFNYFRQLFAQVTNPAIDPIREKLVMSLESFVGPEKNILDETAGHSHKLIVKNPILTNGDAAKIRDICINSFRTKTIFTFFDISGGRAACIQALDRICYEAEYAIETGHSFIILSDRGSGRDSAALPSLLAVSAVHQHLVRKTIRSEVGIVVDSAEPREVHHIALLFAYGADCVNPYLAYEVIEYLIEEGELGIGRDRAFHNYRKALTDGILKILSKMGISTLRSYRGAQIFEALGLENSFIERYFSGTVSRIGGAGLEEIADETIARHRRAYADAAIGRDYLASGGVYQWKKDGEFHLWNPASISALQDAVRFNDLSSYREFARLINDQAGNPTTLRSLLRFRERTPVPLDEVEPAAMIMKRFVTGAMSFGSISRGAHETIAIAMNRIGAKSNTGEGGEDPTRFIPLPNGDSKRSAIKQVASGRFGVTINYLVNADEIQIKIAQGAKPGEGGQLPG